MTAEQLAGIAGGVLSILASFFPIVKDWYDGLTDANKRLVMLGVVTAAGLGVYGLGCFGVIDMMIECGNVFGLVLLIFVAGVANQTVWKFTPVVRERRAALQGQ
jgi:C4-dicarboxylate transporter